MAYPSNVVPIESGDAPGDREYGPARSAGPRRKDIFLSGKIPTPYHITSCVLIGFSLLLGTAAAAAARPITDTLPADSLVVYLAKPYASAEGPAPTSSAVGEQTASGISAIAQILTVLSASGVVSEEGQVYADAAASLPLLGRFEHAIVLIDVKSRAVRSPATQPTSAGAEDDDVSLRLDELQGAIIFRTAGQHRLVLEQLNRLIGRYTHAEVASLDARNADGFAFQELADDRLPGWAVWEWGRIDEFFAVCVGEGTFQRLVGAYSGKQPCLTNDSWFRSANRQTEGDRAQARCYIALAMLGKSLGEPAGLRYARVVAALDAKEMTHDLWTIGLEGRALTWYRCYRRGGQDYTRRYSDPKAHTQTHRRIIPDGAAHYAIIKVPTRWLVDNLPRAWVASQSHGQAETWARVWQRLEEETGVNLDGNLINHLGQHVIIFDYPPHPLGIPLALTIAFEIDNPEAVRTAVNALLGAWSRYLDDRAKRAGNPLIRVQVVHERDGIWYLQAGILGPALKVTDRYVVLSWSPQALREALTTIERPPPR